MSVTVSHDASLRHLNSFGIQASANRLIEVNDDRDLDQAIDLCGDSGPELILGGGSNLLIVAPIRGTVLRLASAHQTIIGQFIELETAALPAALKTFDAVKKTKLKNYPFPKFITAYLQDTTKPMQLF